jgi:hypothetical protein
MAYLRIGDDIEDHPAFVGLSHRAFRVWIYAGAWCQRHLTDGLIPLAILRDIRFASKAILAELEIAGRLQSQDGQYLLVGHTKHNDSREVVQRRRHQKADRVSRWREKHRDGLRDGLQPRPVTMPLTVPHLSSSKNELPSAPRTTRARPHHGHAFCGKRFCLSHKQLEVFQKDLGRLAETFDILAHCAQWDREALETDEPILNLLPWVRERIRRDSGAHPSGDLLTESDLRRAEVVRKQLHGRCPHDPKCSDYQACVRAIALEAREMATA